MRNIDGHKLITWARSFFFKFKCMPFGHVFEKTAEDQVTCPWCGRVYHVTPGEFE